MQNRRLASHRKDERGVIIMLVAVVLLFIVGAMAALAIDLVTFYTARSEAQLAADGAALAAARVLANSGMTSDAGDTTLAANAMTLAHTMAVQVATHNEVGGRNPTAAEVTPSFPNQGAPNFGTNPQVTVRVQRIDLPTFFAHIWGRGTVTLTATATAEAYNPSGANDAVGSTLPVAPSCVKPWLVPNIDPQLPGNRIFDPSTGEIQNTGLLTYSPPNLTSTCTACTPGPGQTASAWQYYPGSPTDFPAPIQSLPSCTSGMSAYQLSVAACVQKPVVCGTGGLNLDAITAPTIDADTADAVTCLAQRKIPGDSNGDTIIDPPGIPPFPPGIPPFIFTAGNDSPITNARGMDVLVSDSLVTVPVVNVGPGGNFNTSPVKVIGFLQLFVNPSGGFTTSGVAARIVNLAGCGTGASGQPILGNGNGPVPVRLVTPPGSP